MTEWPAWGDRDPLVARLLATVEGEITPAADLAPLTTLGVGGRARVLVTAERVEDIEAVARACAEFAVGWLVIGRGSNLLIADRGWDGIALRLGRGFRGLTVIAPDTADQEGRTSDGWRVVVGSAEPMPVLATKLEREGLSGLAFGVAIPGSLGGAVRMNAGAHGGQMADVLAWADVVRLTTGAVERWHPADLHMSYRHTSLPDDAVVTRACLSLDTGDADSLAGDMADMRQWRRDHQPINQRSCGSVFRNPKGDSAGRLIEAAGLKGYRVGGATVSEKHANFITVEPTATAEDVHAIIRHAQAEVQAQHGLALDPEVVIVGFDLAEPGGGGGS